MAEHTFDVADFRLRFPPFADPVKFTDIYLASQWDAATIYLGSYDGCLWSGGSLQLGLNLMTAHLAQINVLLVQGGATPTVGVFTSATVDKVTVTNMPPPARNAWQYWLASTPYGLQLWALLRKLAGVGPYVGGRPELSAFRRVGGRF